MIAATRPKDRTIGPQPPTPLPFDDARLGRFETFVAGLRPVFHRADQFLRFRAYLRGLLEPTERKNVEGLATAAAAVMTVEANLAQALQHFVSQSPWDVGRLLAAVRSSTTTVRDPQAVWVVHDAVFPKKGRHSVGVQRQYARSAGRKLNCQVGVVVAQLGPRGYLPLAARLYLPAGWLRENAETVERTIPEEFRAGKTKVEIALELIDGLRAELGLPSSVVAEDGYANQPAFTEGLTERSVGTNTNATTVADALARFEWLKTTVGLDHFEGRTWHGWHHHVGLVFTAHHFLASEGFGGNPPPATSLRG